jgi:hypothetical protein
MHTAAPCAFKALKPGKNNRLRPDPQEPKLNTRQPDAAMGLGQPLPARDRQSRGQSSSKSSGTFAAKSTAYSNYYSTTSENGHLRVCAHARAHMCVSLSLSGSRVVDSLKSLIQKANCYYFAHYFATTSAVAAGSGLANVLKNLKKGDF